MLENILRGLIVDVDKAKHWPQCRLSPCVNKDDPRLPSPRVFPFLFLDTESWLVKMINLLIIESLTKQKVRLSLDETSRMENQMVLGKVKVFPIMTE